MEEIKLFSDVITELLNNGYSENFSLTGFICSISPENNGFEKISGSDFTIDEVFCCHEDENDSKMMYVFAVSSKKYHLKGIATSLCLVQSSVSLLDFFEQKKIVWKQFLKKFF